MSNDKQVSDPCVAVMIAGGSQVKTIIKMQSAEAPCSACGVIPGGGDRQVRRAKDLSAGGQRTEL